MCSGRAPYRYLVALGALGLVDDLKAASLIDLIEEVDATLVTAALKLGVKPLVDDHLGELGAHDAGAKGKHIGVVVHARELGAEGLGAHDGAHALDLVGGQADADASAADQDAQVDVTVSNCLAHLVAGDGVVEALGGVGAKVHDLAAALLQVLGDDVLELDGGVVVTDTDLHGWFLSGPCGGIAKGFTAFDCMIARLLRKHSGVFLVKRFSNHEHQFTMIITANFSLAAVCRNPTCGFECLGIK